MIVVLVLLLSELLFFSCNEKQSSKNEFTNSIIGKEIKLMPYAVKLIITDSIYSKVDFNAPLKLVTYGDLYCEPCWEKISVWKENIKDFRKYQQLSFLCYLNASQKDFEAKNQEVKLNFPVLLDTRGRFQIVNQIGNEPEFSTFLLDRKNKIIMFGDPFLPQIKKQYIEIIKTKKPVSKILETRFKY